jgi:hypothetical protein
MPKTSPKQGSPTEDTGPLNPAILHAKLHASDVKFAKVVIQLMSRKLEEGHLSYLEGNGWGFTFSEDTVVPTLSGAFSVADEIG